MFSSGFLKVYKTLQDVVLEVGVITEEKLRIFDPEIQAITMEFASISLRRQKTGRCLQNCQELAKAN